MAKTPKAHVEPEFPHPLKVDKIPAAGLALALKANDTQRAALAKRFDLLDLPMFEADLKVDHQSSGSYSLLVTGTIRAKAVQECGVTLEPLPVTISTPLRVTYIEPSDGSEESSEIDLGADEDDIEYIENGAIDVGELVVQHFGVMLDPYPRKPGLDPIDAVYGDAEDEKPENPFAKLIKLQKNPKD